MEDRYIWKGTSNLCICGSKQKCIFENPRLIHLPFCASLDLWRTVAISWLRDATSFFRSLFSSSSDDTFCCRSLWGSVSWLLCTLLLGLCSSMASSRAATSVVPSSSVGLTSPWSKNNVTIYNYCVFLHRIKIQLYLAHISLIYKMSPNKITLVFL